MFFKFIYKFFASFRNPSLFKHYQYLKNNEGKSLIQLKSDQLEKLKELLIFLNNHNTFYQEIIEKYNINLEDFNYNEFQKIPIYSKIDLIQNNQRFITNYKFNKIFNCESSGTSGQVLTFVRNEKWDSFNRASIMRGYSWFGVNIWDFNIYFWGYNFKFLQKLKLRFSDFLLNRFRIFSFQGNNSLLFKYVLRKVKYIEGYSSMIYEMAKKAQNSGFDAPKLLMIKGTSEKIYDHYHDFTKRAFGLKIISEYGAAETGVIAFECRFGNMHINMEGVIVEVDDTNEIIVTNLLSESFPIIRYKLGDIVVLDNSNVNCKCGMQHPIIKEISGRVGKVIYGSNFEYPSLVLYYIFKNIYFDKNIQLSYQAHQNMKGFLDIWVEDELDEKIESIILSESYKYFKNDVTIKVFPKMNLRLEKGKLKDFVSRL